MIKLGKKKQSRILGKVGPSVETVGQYAALRGKKSGGEGNFAVTDGGKGKGLGSHGGGIDRIADGPF